VLSLVSSAYLSISFQAAAAADPNAKLYYNDYTIDNDHNQTPPSPSAPGRGRRHRNRDNAWNQPWNQPWQGEVRNKIDGAKLLVKMVRAKGAKIDGMGLQGHYVYNDVPSAETLSRIINDYAAMDLDVAITELDIRMDMSNINDGTVAMQAQGYANIMAACTNTSRCVGVTLWDFTDGYSWGK
jgi:endo-1,4-beta-xylanase